MSSFPLKLGDRGEPVRDLQRRLATVGFNVEAASPGLYCDRTAESVGDFQRSRGLRPTGACDRDTWVTLVEAGHRLGSRLLTLAAPNLRGDDVAELQSSLARLGFDPGRVDGVLGTDTARALRDFQQNSGLVVDGVCGQATITALSLLARQSGDGPGVAAIKELEAIRSTARSLAELRVVVGQYGGMSAIARQLVQALRQRSATVVASDEPDAVAQASIANRFKATVYVGFGPSEGEEAAVEFFSAPKFESAGGRCLAELISRRCSTVDPNIRFHPAGMQVAILRATRMPAVLISVPQVQQLNDASGDYVKAIVDSLADWVQSPQLSTVFHSV